MIENIAIGVALLGIAITLLATAREVHKHAKEDLARAEADEAAYLAQREANRKERNAGITARLERVAASGGSQSEWAAGVLEWMKNNPDR